jgi:hypothetical protein
VPSSNKLALAMGKPVQVADHGLVIEQAFEAALRNFCLIGRVLGVPAWIAGTDLRRNDRWRDCASSTPFRYNCAISLIKFKAVFFSSCRYSNSDWAGGRLSAFFRRIESGTVCSISSSKDLTFRDFEHFAQLVLVRPDMPVYKPVRVWKLAHHVYRMLVTECGGKNGLKVSG